LTRPEEDPEKEVVEDKMAILYLLKGLEAARKYMCQFDSEESTVVMCNKVENELYRLRTEGRKNK
jgi:hypothetical protein